MKKALTKILFYTAAFLFLFVNFLYYLLWKIWTVLPLFLGSEYRKIIMVLPQWVREAVHTHDASGLFHHIKHLGEMTHQIKLLPIEKQVLYADIYTRTNVKTGRLDVNSSLDQLSAFKKNPELLLQCNTTSVGNIAYIAANSTNEILSKKAWSVLLKMKNTCVG